MTGSAGTGRVYAIVLVGMCVGGAVRRVCFWSKVRGLIGNITCMVAGGHPWEHLIV